MIPKLGPDWYGRTQEWGFGQPRGVSSPSSTQGEGPGEMAGGQIGDLHLLGALWQPSGDCGRVSGEGRASMDGPQATGPHDTMQ